MIKLIKIEILQVDCFKSVFQLYLSRKNNALNLLQVNNQRSNKMNEKRPWTDQEDRILKKLVQDTKFTKWTHIARIISEDYGIKGRNGKQCKERYIKYINTQHPQEEWSYQDQMKMIELHNLLGNKWAIIGQRFGGRTDNSVKNNFYSLLRKALKKINIVVQHQYKSQLKEFKSTILYNIIEVADEKWRGNDIQTDLDFANYSNQLKNQLLFLSLEEDEQSQLQKSEKDREKIKQIINKLAEFGVRYKKRGKKSKNSSKGFNLLTPNRYLIRRTNSENEESQSSNIQSSSASNLSNLEQVSEDDICRSSPNRSVRKNSCNSLSNQQREKSIQDMPSTRSRTRSQGNVFRRFSQQQNFQMKDEGKEAEQQIQINIHQQQKLQNALEGFWEQQNELPMLMIKKSSSRLSNEALIQQPQFHFFEDSEIEMRILPQLDMNMRQSQLDQHMFYQ